MKKLFILTVILLYTMSVNAQVKREGMVWKKENAQRSASKVTKTEFKYEIKDIQYEVYLSDRGSLFIYRISKKGKEYKMYLPKEVQEEMRKVLNITKK